MNTSPEVNWGGLVMKNLVKPPPAPSATARNMTIISMCPVWAPSP